jgi:hypothetical protein
LTAASSWLGSYRGGAAVTDAMKKVLPRGMTLPSLRRMGEAAAYADGLEPGGGDFQKLARFLLDWESFLRLEYVVNDAAQRKKVDAEELQEWLADLSGRLERDRRDAGETQGPVLRTFLLAQIEALEPDLKEVARQLQRKGWGRRPCAGLRIANGKGLRGRPPPQPSSMGPTSRTSPGLRRKQ